MSVTDDLAAAGKDLNEVKQRMAIAGTIMAASIAVATVMRNDEANVWRIVAVKRLSKLTRGYTAGILAAADQLNAELKVINDRKEPNDA